MLCGGVPASPDRQGQGLLLPDDDDEALRTGDGRVEKRPPEDGGVAGQQQDDDCQELRALRFMDADRSRHASIDGDWRRDSGSPDHRRGQRSSPARSALSRARSQGRRQTSSVVVLQLQDAVSRPIDLSASPRFPAISWPPMFSARSVFKAPTLTRVHRRAPGPPRPESRNGRATARRRGQRRSVPLRSGLALAGRSSPPSRPRSGEVGPH